jgi:virulence-associated protein VagC
VRNPYNSAEIPSDRTVACLDQIAQRIHLNRVIAKIFKSGNSLALRLPKELRARVGEVQIEAAGDRWIVSPVKAATWPKGFFARIRLSDPDSFQRPSQGEFRTRT